jgi:hypothetical protein
VIASAVLCSVVDRYAVERKQYSWLNESSTIQGLLDGGEFRQTVYALDRTLGSASCPISPQNRRRTALVNQVRSQWPDKRDQRDAQRDNDNG